MIKSHPRTGWVKADEVSSAEANKELISLRKENDLLKSKIRVLSFQIPEGTERYKQGEDKFTIHYTHDYELLSVEEEAEIYEQEVSWNEIFLSISTLLLNPTNENTMYSEMTKSLLGEHYSIISNDFQTILIQLMALKLIATDTIKVDGVYTYWILTEYGKNVMVNLKAQKK